MEDHRRSGHVACVLWPLRWTRALRRTRESHVPTRYVLRLVPQGRLGQRTRRSPARGFSNCAHCHCALATCALPLHFLGRAVATRLESTIVYYTSHIAAASSQGLPGHRTRHGDRTRNCQASHAGRGIPPHPPPMRMRCPYQQVSSLIPASSDGASGGAAVRRRYGIHCTMPCSSDHVTVPSQPIVGACNHPAPSMLCNPLRRGMWSQPMRHWCLGAQTLSFCRLLPSCRGAIWVIFVDSLRKLRLPAFARCDP